MTMGVLDGMVAIITGAARGQGEAEARLLAENGASVVLTDVLVDAGQAVAADIGGAARFVAHDVASAEGWREVVAQATDTFGRVDVLVNNAAISRPLKLVDTEPEVFDEIYRVNQLGVYLGMRAVVEPMRAVGRGAIVNISSVAGLRGTSTLFAYTATKWAVRGMTRSAALELARYKIRVNAIFPGIIDTPMNDTNPAAMTEVLVKSTPMRRMGEPEEIARAVLFLASPSSSFATGAELAIDGGMSI
jgi:3alpha(or 20beta)-hydroxysteroid dehydrogenase